MRYAGVEAGKGVIACDFDGTLVYERGFRQIGVSDFICDDELIDFLIEHRRLGGKVILWTCREDTDENHFLSAAVEFCKSKGLEFDAINENINDPQYQWKPRKVYADHYFDDKAVRVQFGESSFEKCQLERWKRENGKA